MANVYPKGKLPNNTSGTNALGNSIKSNADSPMDGDNLDRILPYNSPDRILPHNSPDRILPHNSPDRILPCDNDMMISRVANRKRGRESIIGKEEISKRIVDILCNGCNTGKSEFTVSEEMKNRSVLVYDLQTGRRYGILESNECCHLVEWSDDVHSILSIHLKNKEIRYWKDGGWSSERPEIQCLDLDASGKRWKGNSCNGKPYGYGALYGEEGKKVYEGFMMNDVRIGYGIEFYDDIEKAKYDGCFFNDEYFGYGTLYDRHGIVEYQGLWKHSRPYSTTFDGTTIDNHSESVTVPNSAFNEVQSLVPPSFLHSLKQILIEDECFGSVRSFTISELVELECMTIGQKSFTADKKDRFIGSCRMENCPKLKSIQIGDHSFEDYGSLRLSDLPLLQSIQIGDNCFYPTHSFSLTGIILE